MIRKQQQGLGTGLLQETWLAESKEATATSNLNEVIIKKVFLFSVAVAAEAVDVAVLILELVLVLVLVLQMKKQVIRLITSLCN